MASPDDAVAARYAAAIELHRQGRLAEAQAVYREVVKATPTHAGAVMHLGLIAHQQARPDEAIAQVKAALAINPGFEPAYYNLAAILIELGRFGEAADVYRAASAAGVRSDRLQVNQGVALARLGRFDEALETYRQGLGLYPDNAQLHVDKAILLLSLGRFETAWPEYEWRWRLADYTPSRLVQPRWRGEDPAGRTIMLFQEQGVGDTLLFARYAPLVARLAPTVLAVRAPLTRLLSTLPGNVRVFPMNEPLPPFDLQCPLPSLPLAFGTTLQTLPPATPYLAAEPDKVAYWRERLPAGPFRIGVVWQGNAANRIDGRRSARLAELAPLASVPGVRLISLQKQDGLEQLSELPGGMEVTALAGLDDGPDAFVDTAAAMMSLDLVVTIDSAVAHLAGALGRPVWVALSGDAYWVWMREGDRSPWHPTARLFRRQTGEGWTDVFARMAAALRPMLEARTAAAPAPARSPRAPVSWGELIDKITILEIKAARFERPDAVANVERERTALMAELQSLGALPPKLAALKQSLRETNEALFDIENAIREKEAAQSFDDAFIQLARSVYQHNDQRGRLKGEINAALSSELVEEKEYAAYPAPTG
jgi:Flp pilus assembly protein TadD